jgi:UDP-glucose 4-epimerase
MRVLVTGGAGYIGSVSVEALVAAGHEPVILDDLSTGHRASAPVGMPFYSRTYEKRDAISTILGRERIDAVLHCGARSLVSQSMVDPAIYYRENVAGGIALLDAMRDAGVNRFVFSSTAAVYGNPTSTPIREDAAIAPVNAYGDSKHALETALTWYAKAYGLRTVILRYFNAAGASEANGEVHEPETHLIPNILAAANGKKALTIFGDDYPTPDGTCIRDYIHVLDIADAHVRALEATDLSDVRTGPPTGPATPVILNLGNGGGFSVREVISAAEKVTGKTIPCSIGGRRTGDPAVLVADATRAREVLGWTPKHPSIEEMIESAWAWRQAHPYEYGESADQYA